MADEECIDDQNAKVLGIKWNHLEDKMQVRDTKRI